MIDNINGACFKQVGNLQLKCQLFLWCTMNSLWFLLFCQTSIACLTIKSSWSSVFCKRQSHWKRIENFSVSLPSPYDHRIASNHCFAWNSSSMFLKGLEIRKLQSSSIRHIFYPKCEWVPVHLSCWQSNLHTNSPGVCVGEYRVSLNVWKESSFDHFNLKV